MHSPKQLGTRNYNQTDCCKLLGKNEKRPLEEAGAAKEHAPARTHANHRLIIGTTTPTTIKGEGAQVALMEDPGHPPITTGEDAVSLLNFQSIHPMVLDLFPQKLKAQNIRRAGSIRFFSQNWARATGDKFIRKIVSSGWTIPVLSLPLQTHPPKEIPFSKEEREAVDAEVTSMLKMGVISKTSSEMNDFTSSLFVRPKKAKAGVWDWLDIVPSGGGTKVDPAIAELS